MRRAFPMLLLAVMFAVFEGPGRAIACSAGADWNPAREARVIVAGRVEDLAFTDRLGTGFLEVTLTVGVDRYLKGDGPPVLEVIDVASAMPIGRGTAALEALRPEDVAWRGTSGACGAFSANPRGRYLVAGFVERTDGRLQTNLLMTFAVASGPDDPAVSDGVARVQQLLGPVDAPASPTPGGAIERAEAQTAEPPMSETQTETQTEARTGTAIGRPVFLAGAVVVVLLLVAGLLVGRRRPRPSP